MRVRLKPADTHGCAYYRHLEPCRVAQAEGVDAWVSMEDFTIYQAPFGKVVCDVIPENGGHRVTEWQDDVIVLQRPAKTTVTDMIPMLQARGIAVVVDIDDDLACLHPNHPFKPDFDPALSPNINYRNMRRACMYADLVTCTTKQLAECYAPHGRVAVLPNCVPEAMLNYDRYSDGHTIGWSGFSDTHPGDLEVTHGAIPQVLEASDWHFRMVGPAQDVAQRLELDEMEETGQTETIEAYQVAVGTLDIGIVPLGLTKFNGAKSYLKGIEMAARGVPFVASPTEPYTGLAESGIGLVTQNRGRSWRASIRSLMRDEAWREELSQQGKQLVREHHTYEGNGWRWAEAWETAYKHRQAAGKLVLA